MNTHAFLNNDFYQGINHRIDDVSSIKTWKNIRRILIIPSFLCSLFVILPLTLRSVFQDVLQLQYIIICYFIISIIVLMYVTRAFLNDNKIRSNNRKYQKDKMQVMNGTYRCISPQYNIGNFVVFPIKVMRRDANQDTIVMLSDKELIVELNQGGRSIFPGVYDWRDGDEGLRKREHILKQRDKDTEERLTKLIRKIIHKYNKSSTTYFSIKICIGNGAGPTGLSAGITSIGYGETLSAFIGTCLERESVPNNSNTIALKQPPLPIIMRKHFD